MPQLVKFCNDCGTDRNVKAVKLRQQKIYNKIHGIVEEATMESNHERDQRHMNEWFQVLHDKFKPDWIGGRACFG